MDAGCPDGCEGSEEAELVVEVSEADEGAEADEGVELGSLLVDLDVEFVIGSGFRPSLGLSAGLAPSLMCATLHERQL